MNRSSFRENHMAFTAGIMEDEFLQLPGEECPVLLRVVSGTGGRSRNLPPVAGKSALERVKSSHFSANGSPFGSRTSSPAGSLHSSDSFRGSSRRPSVRSHVSDTRRRLISASGDSGRSDLLEPFPRKATLDELDTKDVTSSEDSNEDAATLPLWLDSVVVEVPVVEEKFFTSPTKSKIHLLKSMSAQRSLLGPNYLYGGATAPENKSLEEEEDDAIDHSLKKTFHREIEGDGVFLDDFLARHFHHHLEVDVENLDTISDCTDDDCM